MNDLDKIFSTKLKPLCNDTKDNLRVWEHKTFNIHRAILHYRFETECKEYDEIGDLVRKEINDRFKVSWWRGLGYGVVIEELALDGEKDDFLKYIDEKDNPKGTWQWLIIKNTQDKKIIGIHTWALGYLTSIFIETIRYYRHEGYTNIKTYKKPKGKLLKILTTMSESRYRIPEFKIDPPE